jgi:hypothetical protein
MSSSVDDAADRLAAIANARHSQEVIGEMAAELETLKGAKSVVPVVEKGAIRRAVSGAEVMRALEEMSAPSELENPRI